MRMPTQALLILCATWPALRKVACQSTMPRLAPLYEADSPDLVRNEYIIVFKPDHPIEEHWRAIGMNLSSLPHFSHYDELGGYTVEMNESALDAVRRDRNVDFVEASRRMRASLRHASDFEGERRNGSSVDHLAERQYSGRFVHFDTLTDGGATYNLQMVGAGSKIEPPPQNWKGPYTYLDPAGQGVYVYVMDTGIKIDHPAFEGRAVNFEDKASDDDSPYAPGPSRMEDTEGHGTEVAGVVGAERYGVAQGATIVNVKVFGKVRGTDEPVFETKYIIDAVNAIAKKHRSSCKNDRSGSFRGSVVNMSWSNHKNAPRASGRAFGWACFMGSARGLNFIASAPNECRALNEDDWPCTYDTVTCLGSVDSAYRVSRFVPSGPAINFYAPGENVYTISKDSPNGAKVSGSSIAAPQVAGMAAIFTSWKGLGSGVVKTYLYWNSIQGIVSPYDGDRISDNYFATTGIRHRNKFPEEPFKYGGALRPAQITKGWVWPLSDWKKKPKDAQEPNNAGVPEDDAAAVNAVAVQPTVGSLDAIASFVYGVDRTLSPWSSTPTPASSQTTSSFSVELVGNPTNVSITEAPAWMTSDLGATGVFKSLSANQTMARKLKA